MGLLSVMRAIAGHWNWCFYSFIGLGFLMPSLPAWALVFYTLFVPLFTVRCTVGRSRTVPAEAWGGIVFIGWALLSFLWSPSWHGWLDAVWSVLFIAGGLYAIEDDPAFSERVKRICIAGSTVNSAMSLGKQILGMTYNIRPGGVGMLHVTLPSVIIAGVCLIWACEALLKNKELKREALLAAVILPSFMFLSGSRTPCLCVAVALMVLLCRAPRYHWRRILIYGGSGLALFCLLLRDRVRAFLYDAVARGDSFHRAIWKSVWHDALQHPWIGHGFGALTAVHIQNMVFAHAHNLYLDVFFQGGAVGLVLLLTACIWPFIGAKRSNVGIVACFFFLSCVLLTDMASPLKGPAEIWYVLWVPWLCLVASEKNIRVSKACPML
ncbi:hypothetical protein GS501_06635 [Saccharibacter sp. 17.LH.SD]|uniref:O-antigen ligase family protein n=1 Tax=Saccharibacter sp. 17.LH.SD TaxID=2689393 RepID=UPI00136B9EE4|nr:O-antigen ligase family protein [Saccharibacter sp. 17.LH.SD]MXV44715.1 hypothetical protein [Saccharibacter sp. 17.LH.SD]